MLRSRLSRYILLPHNLLQSCLVLVLKFVPCVWNGLSWEVLVFPHTVKQHSAVPEGVVTPRECDELPGVDLACASQRDVACNESS